MIIPETESPTADLGNTWAEQMTTHGDHMRERLEKAMRHHDKLMGIIRDRHPNEWINLTKSLKPGVWVDHEDNGLLADALKESRPTMHETRKLSSLNKAHNALESIEECSVDTLEVNRAILHALEENNSLVARLLDVSGGDSTPWLLSQFRASRKP